eukprot:scaffold4097_cov306-Pinguiococcus_pyrenoidosus.AAC.12
MLREASAERCAGKVICGGDRGGSTWVGSQGAGGAQRKRAAASAEKETSSLPAISLLATPPVPRAPGVSRRPTAGSCRRRRGEARREPDPPGSCS